MGPNTLIATSSDGFKLSIVLKILDDDTDGLTILEYLNDVKPAANHTIELHGVVDVKIAKVIALRWRTHYRSSREWLMNRRRPSQSNFSRELPFSMNRLTHLDLNPQNVVVDDLNTNRKHPPRLFIIDFGLSVFVEDEETTVKGYGVTPTWVAPEFGTRDDPDMNYSAIRADRWACGRMLDYHLERCLQVGDDSRTQGNTQRTPRG